MVSENKTFAVYRSQRRPGSLILPPGWLAEFLYEIVCYFKTMFPKQTPMKKIQTWRAEVRNEPAACFIPWTFCGSTGVEISKEIRTSVAVPETRIDWPGKQLLEQPIPRNTTVWLRSGALSILEETDKSTSESSSLFWGCLTLSSSCQEWETYRGSIKLTYPLDCKTNSKAIIWKN